MSGLAPLLAHPVLAAATVDSVVFAACALIVLSGAIGVVVSRNPVYSALSLVLTLFGVAVLFVEQQAQFLAAVQVIVYAGAIVVLFLFVIMLLGVDREENVNAEPLRGQRAMAAVLGVAAFGELLALARVSTWATGAPSTTGPATGDGGNTSALAHSIFTTYLFPFEVTSVLLIIAVVGAVILARRPLRAGAPPALPAEEDLELPEVPMGPGAGVRDVDDDTGAQTGVSAR